MKYPIEVPMSDRELHVMYKVLRHIAYTSTVTLVHYDTCECPGYLHEISIELSTDEVTWLKISCEHLWKVLSTKHRETKNANTTTHA
jgi:hypothetical protein